MTAPRPEFQKQARSKLREITEQADKEHPLTEPLDVREVGENVSVNLTFRWWPHPKLRNPDECERAILELLFRRGKTRSKDIVATLRDCEQGNFGESTIVRRLRKLTALKVLFASRRAPRGYDLDPAIRYEAMRRAESA